MAWLRLYDDILDSPKIQMLSDKAFRALINCWCLAKRNGGELTDDLDSLAFSLRMPVGKVREMFQVLMSARLMDKTATGYRPHDWSTHQYESDVSTERVKRFRQRSMKPDETVSETPPDTETEAETDQNQTQTPPVPSPRPIENKNLKSLSSPGNGSGNGHASVTIESSSERIARFQAKLAKHLGPHGWAIVTAASSRDSPEHERSLALCKQAARDLKKGWPLQWPTT